MSRFLLPSMIFEGLNPMASSAEILRKWSDVNIALIPFSPEHLSEYATAAIDARTGDDWPRARLSKLEKNL